MTFALGVAGAAWAALVAAVCAWFRGARRLNRGR